MSDHPVPAHLSLHGLTVLRTDPERQTEFALEVEAFAAPPGARIGLVGRSGSGKSTMLEALGLLLWPDSVSTFVLAGQDLAPRFARRDSDGLARIRAESIGFVPQDAGLLPYLTVRENAILAATLAGGGRVSELPRLAEEIGLSHLLDRLPARLSGGEKQRASVLRAVLSGAKVILADEPTAALDAETAAEVMDSLLGVAQERGVALICASHDVALLRRTGFEIHRIRHHETGARTVATLTREEAG